ncbi:uncharacterized protein GGS25DRAFT_470696 [Hypoxylon fragiforme]|uniref:uncharacterized protein n=1 Tax=Hypoxylon fragiforme TaxID=63214 RepID=UPI0020C5D825|nr:uncharacterized protein GGS25DRAFT_470696 [Hypoxylon fragiforme]KAI2614198.1 hypothetical protein GGS25DRAFT_470696 [Hypoxylon fragiforme]
MLALRDIPHFTSHATTMNSILLGILAISMKYHKNQATMPCYTAFLLFTVSFFFCS